MQTQAEWQSHYDRQRDAVQADMRRRGITTTYTAPPDEARLVQYSADGRPVQVIRGDPQPAPLPREQPRQFTLEDRERAIQMVATGQVATYEAAVQTIKGQALPSTPWQNRPDLVPHGGRPASGTMTLAERDNVLRICQLRQCGFAEGLAHYRASMAGQ